MPHIFGQNPQGFFTSLMFFSLSGNQRQQPLNRLLHKGIPKRLIVCGINGVIRVMVNPEILEKKGIYLHHDDCMSVQERDKKLIKRSAHLKVKYNTLDNAEETLVVKNGNAALLEHEIDHLNGVLNIDY